MEHRWGERLKVALPVRIRAIDGLVGTGLVINLSVSGAFIATSLPAAVLSRVRVSFPAPSRPAGWRTPHRSDWNFEGQVVRGNSGGFAVEWCEFGTEEVVALANSSRLEQPHPSAPLLPQAHNPEARISQFARSRRS